MYRTLTCIAFEHDPLLVWVAATICILGVITTVRVLQIALQAKGRRRAGWLAAASIAGGGSAWSTHFIAMLAYDPGVVVGYAIWPIFLSFAAALAIPGLGFAVLFRRERWAPYIGGICVGLGIAAFHYIGMSGVIIPGRMIWDPGLIAMSAIYSVVFSVASLVAIRRLGDKSGLMAGSLLLVLAIVLLHFTGMGALTIVPDPTALVMVGEIPGYFLAAAASALTFFVIAMAVLCILFDRRLLHEAQESQERLRHMAYHDTLTGMPNRAFLTETVSQEFEKSVMGSKNAAVLAVDLDRFKLVNDIFGHQAGDKLLQALAGIMNAELKPSETLARVGGDEFVIVQLDVLQPYGAEDLAKRILAAVCRDIDVEGVTFRAAASIGIALYPRDGTNVPELHSNADAALYRAKEEGRGCFRFFEPEMDLQLRARRTLQLEMRDALKRGEFKLYYQPQAGTMTGVISGFEALIRWEHPERGLINPDDFISASEENGFIVELGEFVLRTACAEAASWTKLLNISVNLSPVQFQHGDLAGLIRDVLTETGLDPKRLELEITESVLILDFNRAVEILNQIKGLGVCVAMDDFGTGYSSLAYLQAFPFDRIKIDRSFIAKLHENKQSEAIIRAIVGLGRGLNVPVTAEGVETEAQQAFLAELDCAEIQGFLIGRPQPIELLEAHIGCAGENGVRRAVA